jgi:hypothetical protein
VRQALIARIPEVVSQVGPTIVAVPGGQLVCPKPGTNAKLYCTQDTKDSKVAPFEVMNRCVPWFWWDVYAADTGRESPYDGLSGGSGCFHMEIASELERPKDVNRYTPSEKDNIVSLADISGFVEWLSTHTARRWRLPTDTELEFLYQQKVTASGADPKRQRAPPDMHLATSQCFVDSNYYQQSTVERRCDSLSWELSNSCSRNHVQGDSTTTTPDPPSDCQSKQRRTLSLHDIWSSTIDYKARLENLQTYAMLQGLYPSEYLDRDSRLSKSIWIRLVRE